MTFRFIVRRCVGAVAIAIPAIPIGSAAASAAALVPPSAVVTPGPTPSSAFALPAPQASVQPGVSTSGPLQAPSLPLRPVISPTPVPLIVDPPEASLAPGGMMVLHTRGVWGGLSVSAFDPRLIDVFVDQGARTITVVGKQLGSTTLDVVDQRGTHRAVALSVLPLAGRIAAQASVLVTGMPASSLFLAEQAAHAALQVAEAASGASIDIDSSQLLMPDLDVDEIATVRVPVLIHGPGYIPVMGTTLVRLENFAQPHIHPTSLVVSDLPEKITAPGPLIATTLGQQNPTRFLYYHYNPIDQPRRRIVLRAENSASEPALVQLIEGCGGPDRNEMQVGHLATQRFLVRESQNEGRIIEIAPYTSTEISVAPLPPGTTVNTILQLRELQGHPLALTLAAEDIQPLKAGALPKNEAPAYEHHARGIYPIPEFFLQTTYPSDGDPLTIPLGFLPLPNLRQGEALAGDYGVLISLEATITNDSNESAPVAIYANPRGGRATGTFLIDRTLVQAHALPPRSHFKLRQYIVPAHGFVHVQVVTMPEGGSSYPVDLIFAPDDGSVSPGSISSPIY